MSLPQVKQGLKFNGLTDYVDTGKTASQFGIGGSNPRSIEAWVNVNQWALNAGIWQLGNRSLNNDFSLKLGSATVGSFVLNLWGADLSFTFGSTNQWIHFIATFDGVNLKVYGNGSLIASNSPVVNTNDSVTFRLGRWDVNYLNGLIAATRIYNRALTADEVTANYNGHVTRNGLVGEWLLNEGTGTVATDTSGNGNNGTINGATWIIKKAPIKGRKNLLPPFSQWIIDAGITASINAPYSVDVTFPTTIVKSITSPNITLSPSTPYAISFNAPANTQVIYAEFDSLGNVITGNTVITSGQTITTKAAHGYCYLQFRNNSIAGTFTFSNPQMEKGALATSFEPYIPITDAKPMPQKPKKNMLPPFTDSAWTLHENTRMQIADFSGKVFGSTVENPHIANAVASPTLTTNLTGENFGGAYNNVSSLDGSVLTNSNLTSGNIQQHRFSFDVIQHVIRKFGASVFGSAVSLADRVAWVKAGNVSKIVCNWNGFGSGPLGNKAYLRMWHLSGAWDTQVTHTNAITTKLSIPSLSADMLNRIDANGFISFLAFTDASDGVTASTINTDAVNLEVYLTEAAYAPLRQATSLGLNATAAFQNSSVKITALPNTAYVFKHDGNGRLFVQPLDSNSANLGTSGVSSNGGVVTYTTPIGTAFLLVKVDTDNATGQFTFDKPQLELGSVATSFENYKLISDVKLVPLVPKKNMLPSFTDSAWTIHPNAVIVNPTSLLLNATNQSQESRITVPVIPGQTYTVSSTNGSDGSHRLYVFKNDLVTAYGSPLTSGYSSFTFTPTENTVVIKLYNFPAATGIFTFDKPQLEKGVVATPFENYQLVHDVKHI